MKAIKAFNILICMLLVCHIPVYAYNFEKRKNYTQSYPLHHNQKVKIANKFGKVQINAWSRNEVKVDVVIITSSNDEKVAQSLLDNISIESNTGNPIVFTTKFSSSNSGSKNKNSQSKMEINYIVYMPATTPLDVKNEFGNTFVPDWSGVINLDQCFGNVTTGSLPNAKDINVKFGALTSSSIKDGNIQVSYSSLSIDKLTGSVSSKIDFCKDAKLGLHSTLEKLDAKVSYSDIIIHISPNLQAAFQIKTSFGSLKNKSNIEIINQTKDKKNGPVFDKTYKGIKGSGASIVNINSSFGDITLQ